MTRVRRLVPLALVAALAACGGSSSKPVDLAAAAKAMTSARFTITIKANVAGRRGRQLLVTNYSRVYHTWHSRHSLPAENSCLPAGPMSQPMARFPASLMVALPAPIGARQKRDAAANALG